MNVTRFKFKVDAQPENLHRDSPFKVYKEM